MGRQAHNDRKSMEGFFAIMDLIKDPEKYEEGINELIKRHDAAEAMVESIVPAKEIEAARSQAFSKLNEARALVESAKKKAKKIMDEAQVNIDKDRKDASERLLDLDRKEKELGKEVGAKVAAMNSREKVLIAREEKAEEMLVEGDKLYRLGNELKQEFESKLQKMRNL